MGEPFSSCAPANSATLHCFVNMWPLPFLSTLIFIYLVYKHTQKSVLISVSVTNQQQNNFPISQDFLFHLLPLFFYFSACNS